MGMDGVKQKFVNAMTRPGFDAVKGAKKTGLSKVAGWAKTLAANILTFGGVYIIARRIEFKAKLQAEGTRVKNADELTGQADKIAKLTSGNESEAIAFYKTGITEVFGNFAPCKVHYEGKEYKSVEAAFQAAKWEKVLKENDSLQPEVKGEIESAIQNMQNAETADAALKIQRGLEDKYPDLFPQNWKGDQGGISDRDQVMWNLLVQKFTQEPYRSCLLTTGEAFLLEHRTEGGRDAYWSDGHDGNGGNRLGDMLMELRSQLRNETISDEPPASKINEDDFIRNRLRHAGVFNRKIRNNTLGYAPYTEGRNFLKFLFTKPVSREKTTTNEEPAESRSASQVRTPKIVKTKEEKLIDLENEIERVKEEYLKEDDGWKHELEQTTELMKSEDDIVANEAKQDHKKALEWIETNKNKLIELWAAVHPLKDGSALESMRSLQIMTLDDVITFLEKYITNTD